MSGGRLRANRRLAARVKQLEDALGEACDVLAMAADIIEEDAGADEEEVAEERERIVRLRAVLNVGAP